MTAAQPSPQAEDTLDAPSSPPSAGGGVRVAGQEPKLGGLELTRFLLAFTVLVYHYFYYAPCVGAVPIELKGPAFLAYGRFAVEAFFVLSGYVIVRTLRNRSALDFAIARIGRLWPALAICALLTTLVNGRGPRPLAEALAFFPLLFNHGLVDDPYWSIVIELRFYALVTLLLLTWTRLSNIDLLCAIWLAASTLALWVPALATPTLAPYSAFFIFGLLLHSQETGSRLANWLVPPALALASAQAWMEFEYVDLLDGVRSPRWVGAVIALVVFFGISSMRIELPRPLARIAVVLGAMTYPLYLVHGAMGYAVVARLAPYIGNYPAAAVATGCALGIAWITSRYLEPFMRPRLSQFLKGSVRRLRPSLR